MTRPRRRAWAARVAGTALAVATAVFVGRECVELWPQITDAVGGAAAGWVVAAALVFLVAEPAYALAWPFTLRALGHPVVPARGASLFLVTQTAKFVPGVVWPLVGRVGAAGAAGVPRRVTGASLVVEAGASVAAALAVGGLTGVMTRALHGDGDAGPAVRAGETAVLVLGAVVVLVVVREIVARAGHPVGWSDVAAIATWHLAVWTAYGGAAALLAQGLGVPALPTMGAFALSWLAGFVVVGAPAGLGVREAAMIALLAPVTDRPEAVAVALGSRALWTAAQLAWAAVAVAVRRRDWRLPASMATTESVPQ